MRARLGWRDLVAVHVHHGLQKSADAWVAHCEAFCVARKVPYATRKVTVQARGRGLEAAAREVRYAALAEAAHARGAQFVLTAHHQDDRIETFLIQWLRGAGPDGLAAFPAARAFADGTLQLLRPFIDVPRSAIERYVRLRALDYVDDASNDDPALLRNAVRRTCCRGSMRRGPASEPRPRARSTSSPKAAEAMRSMAATDLAACTEDAPEGMLRLDRLSGARRLRGKPARCAPGWRGRACRRRVAHVCSKSLEQARNARSDAKLLVRLGSYEVRRYRGLLLLKQADDASRDSHVFTWRGEEEVPLPSLGRRIAVHRG